MKSLNKVLIQAPITNRLSDNERAILVRSALRRKFEKGEYIAHYGEVWPKLFVIESGTISVLKLSSEGRNLGALRLGNGDIFLSPSLLDEGPLPASLEVKEACVIYIWHRDQFLGIIRGNHDALWQMCLLLVKRIRQASKFVEDLVFQPVTGRLARLLLDQFEEGEDTHFPRELTLDEMSTMIGTTPVMVCKMLSRFAADGLIKVSRTEFELLNHSDLVKLAGR